jgi:hypothetical protein
VKLSKLHYNHHHHKVADGGYTSRPTQTANNPQKNQNDMAAPCALRAFGVQVTAYEITDETVDSQTETLDDVAGVGLVTGRRSSINPADDSGDDDNDDDD